MTDIPRKNFIYSNKDAAKNSTWVWVTSIWWWIHSWAVNLSMLTDLLKIDKVLDNNIIVNLESAKKVWEDASSQKWNAGSIHFGFMEPNYPFDKALKTYLSVLESLTILNEHADMYPAKISEQLKKDIQDAIIWTPWETIITKSQKINIEGNYIAQEKWIKELGEKKMSNKHFTPKK